MIRRFIRVSKLSVFTAGLAVAPGGGQVSAQEMGLRAVYNALSGVMAPVWVAQTPLGWTILGKK